jgi:hypothetical protein
MRFSQEPDAWSSNWTAAHPTIVLSHEVRKKKKTMPPFSLRCRFDDAKNGLFEPFIYNIAHFTKTGSGQT